MCLHWQNLLFALPLALADHRLPAPIRLARPKSERHSRQPSVLISEHRYRTRFAGHVQIGPLSLWHWPIIVFQHQYALLVPNQSVTLGSHQFLFRNIVIVLVSLVMSILSWRFVEQPFRRGYTTRARSGILIYGAASVALLISFGGTILLEHGFRNRFSPEALRFASRSEEH